VVVLSGNDAVGLGSIIAGLDFFAAYPITRRPRSPATSRGICPSAAAH